MELRPGTPVHGDIRIRFAVQPSRTALLIAVLEGLDVVEGQAPEAAAHNYDSTRSFLGEFYPGDVGDPSSVRLTPRS